MAGRRRRSSGQQRQPERDEQGRDSPQPALHSDPPSRRKRPFIEELPADAAALSALWPELEPWLMARLLRRGLAHATAKDACQVVAERLLTKRARFESAEHFYNWLNIVARNLVSNWQRNDSRLSTDVVPEGSSPDAARAVEPRLELEATVAAFTKLSEADRLALRTALRLEQRGDTQRERDRV